MKDLVISHKNCADGMTAAWLFHHFQRGQYDFKFCHYGDEPPDVTGRNTVYITDFSFPRHVLEDMRSKVETFLVLDHHKTAEADLNGLPYCIFDQKKSGAEMVLDHVFNYEKEHFRNRWVVAYTADRDLWQWKLPSSKEVNATISSFEMTMEDWDALNCMSIEDAMIEGRSILRYQNQVIRNLVKNARWEDVDGSRVPVLNTGMLISEVGNILAQDNPFAMCWFQRPDGKVMHSLRSTDKGRDVSEIAKKFGGGGHRNAAGFLGTMADRAQ